MSESSKDTWFYTRNGERLGPSDKETLQELAASGELNPRLDLCWTQGMEQWVPAGEIEGLFEAKRTEKPDENIAEDGSFARQAKPLNKLSEDELELALLNAEWPGASRRIYLFVIWVLPFILGAAVAGMAFYFLDPEDPSSTGVLSLVTSAVTLIVMIAVIFISLQRLQNLGMSRWWFLGNFVPLLNLWVGYRSICCPAGYEYHRKIDGMGVLLAILYWGLILLSIAMFALAVLALLGLVGGGIFGNADSLLEQLQKFNPEDGTSNGGE